MPAEYSPQKITTACKQALEGVFVPAMKRPTKGKENIDPKQKPAPVPPVPQGPVIFGPASMQA
jgi:hypothetical protein